MFHHEGALQHPLRPGAYVEPRVFDTEMAQLFVPAWHFACLGRDVLRPGDQVARDLAGVPIVIRNEGGELRAFVNVCAHRHSTIAAPGWRNAATLRCQYHGWEYDADGALCRLPDGRSFKGMDAKAVALRRVSLEVLGPLVMATLNNDAPPFLASLGDFGTELQRFFGNHRLLRLWTSEHAVNWKVIAENAVESYHVPQVHPATFRDFREPSLHDHTLHERYTRYLDLKPWENDVVGIGARSLSRLLLKSPTMKRFTQAHVFPGLLLYYGDLVSTLIALEPLGAGRTRHVVLSFVPRTLRGGALLRPLQWLFGQVFASLGERILREDMRLWPAIQHGLAHSPHRGVLSCREERVHAFQTWVAAHVAEARALSPGEGLAE